MDLFAHAALRDSEGQPLAERMRPLVLDEVVGQERVLGSGTWLRRAIENKRLSSVILWGPPGVGKTTLGRLLAREIGARFVPLSAVMSGIKEVREAVAVAAERRQQFREITVLFIDEIHRFNKAQQDALLPHVEDGTIVLVGATTENPAFEVNAPLLSRARILVLEALEPVALRVLIDRALSDPKRGLGALPIDCAPEVRDLISREAGGDARRALAILEAAAAVPAPDAKGRVVIDTAAVEAALLHRTLRHDKSGDEHYGVVSAFIKSMRGSDADASVYWLARMLEAGEDPMFVARRIVIFAAEDVGNADPAALGIAVAAMQATQLVGYPESYLPLTQAVTYLALAPKSNSALKSYANAREAVRKHGALPVPAHLRNATSSFDAARGIGRDYRYPHDAPGHIVAESYLPAELREADLYAPGTEGQEQALAQRAATLRSVLRGKRSAQEP